MKVVLLAPAGVLHTQRWAEALAGRGIEVVLASQHDPGGWPVPPGVRVMRLPKAGPSGYFRNVGALRTLLRRERPALLNAHYASGYGTMAALAGFHPLLLSVWGSDVYDFPNQGRIQRWLLCRNLRKADAVASTSEAMAGQVRRLVPERQNVFITPFGVDTARFAPRAEGHAGFVVGTVKTLAPKYGIDILIRAFAERAGRFPAVDEPQDARLVIVGDGPERGTLESLCRALGIECRVRFVGAVAHDDVARWLHGFDVYVAVSRLDSESFGVAVIEASACGLPVVVSDAGGLPEVVVDGQTGIVVPRDDPAALAAALERLAADPALRRRLGVAGRARVQQHYEWSRCVDRMVETCSKVVADSTTTAST